MSMNTANQTSRETKHSAHEGVPEGNDSVTRAQCEITLIDQMVQPDQSLIMAHDPYDPRCEKVNVIHSSLLSVIPVFLRRGTSCAP